MTAVTLSDDAIGKLRPCVGPAELRDAAGNLIGYFTPVESREPLAPQLNASVAGDVYRLGELALPTGVRDLAVNIDHYLYGHPRQCRDDE